MIVKIIIALYYVIFFITLVYGMYFLLTGVIGILKKDKVKFKEAKNYNHFALLIAARNEETVIGNLIDSLNNLKYPKDKYDVYVVPNNCTDKTAEISKKSGANIINCTFKTKTKGDVLKFAFEKLKDNKKIDAYIIFDADNIVHPDFLKHMNNCLESGYNVAEGFRDAKNPDDNWLSGSYTLFYLFQNVFFNRARMAINGSAAINGTGFMIKKELIDKDGFETFSLTEDVEFTGQCALKGYKIAFVEDAITYDEYPNKFTPSCKQRKRWSAGILECMKIYSPRLFINAFKKNSIASLDMSLVYLGPLMQILNFINVVMLICFRIFGIELHDLFSYIFASGIYYFLITLLIGILVEIFTLIYKNKKVRPVISGIILFPLFVFTWIPINILCIIKKQTKWDEIKHNRNINISDILK